MNRAYLDEASTSPLRPAALAAMVQWLEASAAGAIGDPGRVHTEGMTARAAIESAREQVAALVGSRPREVVFCSGATEAIAMACFGAREARGPESTLSAVEHSAVRDGAGRGEATVVGCDRTGRVDPDALLERVSARTALIHLQWGNHEVGTLQPVAEVASHARALGVWTHVDAAQAVGRVPVSFRDLDIDFMSVSAHKFGGPSGIGALVIRRGVRVPPMLVGGDQERARRAGMESVAAIMGFGAAASAAIADLSSDEQRCRAHTGRIIEWADRTEGVNLLGNREHRLPHIVCLGIDGVEPQPVLLGLDRAGVAVHSGSSCSSEALEPSPVLEAMGVDAQRSLRISVGWSTTESDIDRLLEVLPVVLRDLRSLRSG